MRDSAIVLRERQHLEMEAFGAGRVLLADGSGGQTTMSGFFCKERDGVSETLSVPGHITATQFCVASSETPVVSDIGATPAIWGRQRNDDSRDSELLYDAAWTEVRHLFVPSSKRVGGERTAPSGPRHRCKRCPDVVCWNDLRPSERKCS